VQHFDPKSILRGRAGSDSIGQLFAMRLAVFAAMLGAAAGQLRKFDASK